MKGKTLQTQELMGYRCWLMVMQWCYRYYPRVWPHRKIRGFPVFSRFFHKQNKMPFVNTLNVSSAVLNSGAGNGTITDRRRLQNGKSSIIASSSRCCSYFASTLPKTSTYHYIPRECWLYLSFSDRYRLKTCVRMNVLPRGLDSSKNCFHNLSSSTRLKPIVCNAFFTKKCH